MGLRSSDLHGNVEILGGAGVSSGGQTTVSLQHRPLEEFV